MFKVRVHKMESYRDCNSNLGKRIELVEDIELPKNIRMQQSEEGRVVTEVMTGLQQVFSPLQCMQTICLPKIILFLTEEQYEQLGIVFNVNQTYDVVLENQSIKFVKEEKDS